ncbi:MAG: hypothetical protein K8I65_13190 [Thermoanaerobaculia bacterium]|nr:hypothetical protein [Thermoanaerobaculia bacterium]
MKKLTVHSDPEVIAARARLAELQIAEGALDRRLADIAAGLVERHDEIGEAAEALLAGSTAADRQALRSERDQLHRDREVHRRAIDLQRRQVTDAEARAAVRVREAAAGPMRERVRAVALAVEALGQAVDELSELRAELEAGGASLTCGDVRFEAPPSLVSRLRKRDVSDPSGFSWAAQAVAAWALAAGALSALEAAKAGGVRARVAA